MRKPVSLEKALRTNLDKTLAELIFNGEELTVTDPVFHDTSLNLVVNFTDVPDDEEEEEEVAAAE